MSRIAKFYLVHAVSRQRAIDAVMSAPHGARVSVDHEPKRTALQNDRFHAMVEDIAKQAEFNGRKIDAAAWKVLLVSGHTIATGGQAEIVTGLEGELVNLRESTAGMSKRRGASLIDYTQCWGDMRGIVWSEPVPEPV